jgi:hypothetical protein
MLAKIQDIIKQSLLYPTTHSELYEHILENGFSVDERIDIYRNNVISSLKSVLSNKYPVVKNILGLKFFSQIAVYFINKYPPKTSSLIYWAEDFPSFTNDFKPLEEYPYIYDIAQLELLSYQTYYAREDEILLAADLQSIDPSNFDNLSLVLRDTTQVLSLDYEIYNLWQEYLKKEKTTTAIKCNKKTNYLLINRLNYEVKVEPIQELEYFFIKSQNEGKNIGNFIETIDASQLDLFQNILAKHIINGSFRDYKLSLNP